MAAVLGEEEKHRIRHHLGYVLTDPVASIQLGVPRSSQPQFLLEMQMNRIPESAIGQIRRWIAILDEVENKLVDSQDRLAADSLGDIKLRADEPGQLEREYSRWAKRLADDLGVPLNAYSERFRSGGGLPLSVPIVH